MVHRLDALYSRISVSLVGKVLVTRPSSGAAPLGISEQSVNLNGGAIALGHPVGMSGTRIALSLLLELRRRGGGIGAAALCGGGGQGDALLVRTR